MSNIVKWVYKPTLFLFFTLIFLSVDGEMNNEKQKKEVLVKFGKHLAEVRKSKKLSFRKLSAACDVDYSDIKKYEKGEKDLRLLTIIDLAIGLDINPKELLNFDFEFLKKYK